MRDSRHLDAIARLTLRCYEQKKWPPEGGHFPFSTVIPAAYQLDAQLVDEEIEPSKPVRMTTPVQTGSMTLVVSLAVVVDVVVGVLVVVGQVHAAEGASAWRRAVGDVALSEHAASTRTAPPKNSAFFQPM